MLRDLTGYRGERIVEMCLTDPRITGSTLFRPAFLGDKWPAIDFYVELANVPDGARPYFFVQARATAAPLSLSADVLAIQAKRNDVARLLRIPGPTYLFGVHEPSERVFVRSVHAGVPVRAITTIPLAHELTATNLQALYNEVRLHWSITVPRKPAASEFS